VPIQPEAQELSGGSEAGQVVRVPGAELRNQGLIRKIRKLGVAGKPPRSEVRGIHHCQQDREHRRRGRPGPGSPKPARRQAAGHAGDAARRPLRLFPAQVTPQEVRFHLPAPERRETQVLLDVSEQLVAGGTGGKGDGLAAPAGCQEPLAHERRCSLT
jgi:hypothetical protein